MSSSCPGFKPHGVKPMKCRRCFKDYSEHPQTKSQLDLSYSYFRERRDSSGYRDSDSAAERRSSYASSGNEYSQESRDYANDSTSWPRVRRRDRGAYTDDEADFSSTSRVRRRQVHVTFKDETSLPSNSAIRRRRIRRAMANGSDYFSTSLDGMSTAESEGEWLSDAPQESSMAEYRRSRLRQTRSEDDYSSYREDSPSDRGYSSMNHSNSESNKKSKKFWFEEDDDDEPNEKTNSSSNLQSYTIPPPPTNISSRYPFRSESPKVSGDDSASKSNSVNSTDEKRTPSKTLTTRPESPRSESKTLTSRPESPRYESKSLTSRPESPRYESKSLTSRPESPRFESKTLTSRPESPRFENKSRTKPSASLSSDEKASSTTKSIASRFEESKSNEKPPIKSILKTDSSRSEPKTTSQKESAPTRSSVLRAELAKIEEKLAKRESVKAEKAAAAKVEEKQVKSILKTESKIEDKPAPSRPSWATRQETAKAEDKQTNSTTESPKPFSSKASLLKSESSMKTESKPLIRTMSNDESSTTSPKSDTISKPPPRVMFRPESPKPEMPERPTIRRFGSLGSLKKVEEKPPPPKPPLVSSRIEERRASLLGRITPEPPKPEPKNIPGKLSYLRNEPSKFGKKEEKPQEPKKKIEIIAAKEIENPGTDGSTSDVEFVLQLKTPKKSSTKEKFSKTETAEATIALHDKIDDLNSTVSALKKRLESTESKCERLEKEKEDVLKSKKETETADKAALDKSTAEVKKLRTKVNEMDAKNDDLRKENRSLKQEMKKLRDEMDNLKLEKREEMNKLQGKLKQAEKMSKELTEENEDMKKEVKKLEEELEELHDNFREDQASEFRDLKRELENNAKNCRVLQFKLKKSERNCDQLETEKLELEERLKEILETTKINVDQTKMRELETELKLAKEVSTKMHNEIETQKEIRNTLETEMNNLRQQLLLLQNEAPGSREKHRPVSPNIPGSGKDYETLARDLYDTLEREADLREQMRFAEDESRNMRKKLTTLEQENDILMLQIRKMASPASKKRGKSNENEDELSADELKLQLDLNEQEMQVLRKRSDELEQENENLQKEVRYLQDKIVSQPTIQMPEIKPGSSPNVIYEHKIRILENEAKELRKKLVDKDRENESLRTELDVHRRKASRVIVRSRSLDGDIQVDLKRQLQLVEQEAGVLRQKVMNLENDNEKLTTDNKRLSLRLSKKPPPGPAEEVQLENILLQEKVKELEGKIAAIKEEFEKVASGSVPATIITEYKPKKEIITETENELINSLKKTVKLKEDENSNLQTKLTQTEVENHRLNRELKKLKDTINFKKRPSRVVRETATRGELKEIIKELEDEISEMHVTLRGREVMTEGMKEELENTKRELEVAQNELKTKEEELSEELDELTEKKEELEEELDRERERAKSLEQKLKQVSQQKGTDIKLLEQIESLQKEKTKLSKNLEETESRLVQKQKQVQELDEKVKIVTTMKDELMQTSKLLEGQKKDLEKELTKHRESLSKAEKQVKELAEKAEASDKDIVALKKECNQLKNELEEERGRLRQADSKVSEVSVNWSRERADFRREISDLRDRNECLEKEIKDKVALWEQTEKQIRENMAMKREKAIQEVREEAEAEIQSLTDEANTMKAKLNEALEQLEKTEEEFKEASEKYRTFNNQVRKEREEWQSQQTELEGKLRTETRKRERLERDHEVAMRLKDEDLLSVKDRLVQAERDHRRAQQRLEQVESDMQDSVRLLERELAKEKQNYEEMSAKYEIMEENFTHTKQLWTDEKEELLKNMARIRNEFDETFSELKALKENFNNKQNTWINERIDFQEKIKEMTEKVKRIGAWEEERKQLLATLQQKESLVESYRSEEKHLKEEREKHRRKIEELENKVSDLERAERAYRTSTMTAKAEGAKEANDLRIHLGHSDKVHKAEMAAMKAEYEGRITLMGEEIQNLQKMFNTISKERDSMRARLEELRVDPDLRYNSKYKDEADDLRAQCSEVRNLLEEALLENRNMKVQHASERSSWQIQMAEMKTKVNQLEEKYLLETSKSSGRNFAKTRLELAWEKERNEQQRLLSETQKFVNELKDKVIQMETLREKERQEARKQLQDLKASMDRDQQETQSVVADLQLGLVDLRDKHVRLRAQYERLRKDRERLLVEREEFRDRLISLQDIQNKVADLAADVQMIAGLLPTGEYRGGSNPPSPQPIPREELRSVVEKLQQRIEELRKLSAPMKDDERLRRAMSFRRTLSSTDMSGPQGTGPSPASSLQRMPQQRVPGGGGQGGMIRAPPRQRGPTMNTLNRKSLSLDHSMTQADLNKIWDSGGELSSANTTPSGSQVNLRLGLSQYRGLAYPPGYESDSSFAESVSEFGRSWSRESSVDNVTPAPAKVKKGLKEKLKMLAGKSKSVDQDSSADEYSAPPSRAELREKESSLRSRISKALKKPLSRSGSTDKTLAGHEDTPERAIRSMERPLMPIKETMPYLPPAGSAPSPGKGEKSSKKSSTLGRPPVEKTGRSMSIDSDSGHSTMRSSKSSLNPSETRV